VALSTVAISIALSKTVSLDAEDAASVTPVSQDEDDVSWPVADEGVELRKSKLPHAGLGLFATKDFQPGEFVASFHGKHVPVGPRVEKLRDQRYVAEFTDGETGAIDATDSVSSGGRYANHIKDPNAEYEQRPDLKKMWLKAKKGIKAGDEITLAYEEGKDWDHMQEGACTAMGSSMMCSCGMMVSCNMCNTMMMCCDSSNMCRL
jgi:hypothetical protein